MIPVPLFAPQGPFGSVPLLPRSYCGTPTSRPPVEARSRSPRRSARRGAGGTSQVPRQTTRTRALALPLRWPSGAGLRDFLPTRRAVGVAFRVSGPVGGHHFLISEPAPRPACPLSTLRATDCSDDPQDSLLAGGPALARRDLNPQGCSTRFQSSEGITWHPPGRSLLGAPKQRLARETQRPKRDEGREPRARGRSRPPLRSRRRRGGGRRCRDRW